MSINDADEFWERGRALLQDNDPKDGAAPTPEEGLRLIAAFARIREPSDRHKIIEFAERLAVPSKD